MTKLLRVGALLAAFTLMMATPALATHGQPDRTVPFHAVSVGSSVDSYGPPTCPGANWQFFSSGTAVVTHLGLSSTEVTHCSWIDSPTTGHFGPGTLTFTAANGDTLILSQSGTFQTVMTPESFTSYVTAEWEVVGGTGRFEGARGSGEARVVGDILLNSSASEYWGTIEYDASNAASE